MIFLKKRKIKITFILFAFFIIVGVFYSFMRQKDTQDIQTHLALSSNEFSRDYVDNKSHLTIVDKAIEVEGIIHEISRNKQKYSILLQGNKKNTYVICEMQKDQNSLIVNLQNGESVKIKGVFKGFLKDAILLNCILIDTKNE